MVERYPRCAVPILGGAEYGRFGVGSVADMTSRDPMRPTSLDHVALWTAERDRHSALLCTHLGMHEIERTDAFTLVGADARQGKLTLFDAPGPREPGALARAVLRVGDLAAAVDSLPAGLVASHNGDSVTLQAPEGFVLGLVERPGCELDYDLDHVVVRVSDVDAAAAALEQLGFERDVDRLVVGDRFVQLVGGGSAEGSQPLLNHLAVLVDSAAAVEEAARARGADVAEVKDAANTLAVFVWGPDRIKVEYVEHKPSFSLV
jgi:catechol 2,3-dioxygenase-like lactoylglutathione lyase family enzyme